MNVIQNPQNVLLGVSALGHNGLQAAHGIEWVRLSWQAVHVQEQRLRAGHAKHLCVDRECGVDERLGDRFPTRGHAHLGVLGRDVGSARLVPAMSAGVQLPKINDCVDALELRPAHRLVVVGHILPQLHCGLDAGGLIGMNDECAGAAQHPRAPLFQDFYSCSRIDVPGDRKQDRVHHLFGVDGKQRAPLVRWAVFRVQRNSDGVGQRRWCSEVAVDEVRDSIRSKWYSRGW